MQLSEEWRQISDWPHYEVSSEGRVRRVAPGKGTRVGLVLKLRWRGPEGRQYLSVCLTHDRLRRDMRVNVLVAEAFHGPRPDGFVAAHLDGQRSNNRSTNIAWVTPAENESHKLKHGSRPMGERQWCSKLTAAAVREIRSAEDYRGVGRHFAQRFDVSPALISKIRKGHWWRHVT